MLSLAKRLSLLVPMLVVMWALAGMDKAMAQPPNATERATIVNSTPFDYDYTVRLRTDGGLGPPGRRPFSLFRSGASLVESWEPGQSMELSFDDGTGGLATVALMPNTVYDLVYDRADRTFSLVPRGR
jgi:hypothetical protein